MTGGSNEDSEEGLWGPISYMLDSKSLATIIRATKVVDEHVFSLLRITTIYR